MRGKTNTANILAFCKEEGIAAELADDYSYGGYDDWYLPSTDELQRIYFMEEQIDGIGQVYWSSTELDETYAKTASTVIGMNFVSTVFKKDELRKVRAVRSF